MNYSLTFNIVGFGKKAGWKHECSDFLRHSHSHQYHRLKIVAIHMAAIFCLQWMLAYYPSSTRSMFSAVCHEQLIRPWHHGERGQHYVANTALVPNEENVERLAQQLALICIVKFPHERSKWWDSCGPSLHLSCRDSLLSIPSILWHFYLTEFTTFLHVFDTGL